MVGLRLHLIRLFEQARDHRAQFLVGDGLAALGVLADLLRAETGIAQLFSGLAHLAGAGVHLVGGAGQMNPCLGPRRGGLDARLGGGGPGVGGDLGSLGAMPAGGYAFAWRAATSRAISSSSMPPSFDVVPVK